MVRFRRFRRYRRKYSDWRFRRWQRKRWKGYRSIDPNEYDRY